MTEKRPSRREDAKRGVANKQPPAPDPAAAPPAPQRQSGGKPAPPPFVRFEKVIARCGHEVDFGLFEDRKDKFREDRRKKKMGQLCPACREQKQQEEQAVAAARRAAKQEQQPERAPKRNVQLVERLPHGSCFNVVYDAGKTEWSGTLTVGSATFTDSASGVFRLLEKLDRLYRSSRPSNC